MRFLLAAALVMAAASSWALPDYCTLRHDQLNFCMGGPGWCDIDADPGQAIGCAAIYGTGLVPSSQVVAGCAFDYALEQNGVNPALTVGQIYNHEAAIHEMGMGNWNTGFDSQYDFYCWASGVCPWHSDGTSECFISSGAVVNPTQASLQTQITNCVTAKDCSVSIINGHWLEGAYNSKVGALLVGLLLGIIFIMGLSQ